MKQGHTIVGEMREVIEVAGEIVEVMNIRIFELLNHLAFQLLAHAA